MIQNLLKTCGLNDSEQMVLLALVERGPSIASILAKHTKLKRPTVYAVLENLIRLGLVIKYQKERATYFSPISAEHIPRVLQDRAEEKFTEIRMATKTLAPHLAEFSKKSQHKVGGFAVAAIENPENIYLELESELLRGDFSAFFNPQVFDEKYWKLVKAYLEKTAKSRPHIREIAIAGSATNQYINLINNPNHQVKQISSKKTLPSDMILSNQTVTILNYGSQKSVGIKIIDPHFYTSMMTIFETLWETL